MGNARSISVSSARFVTVACVASLSALTVLVPGCGGSSPPAKSASSGGPAAEPPDGGATSALPASGPATPSAPSTTTQTLGDAGDVQGTKLQSSSTASSSADMADAGPGRGPHQSEPGRAVKDIQVIVQAHRDEARACYDRAQQAHPDPSMKGNLDVKWTIDPTGKVTEIAVDDSRSDIHDPAIGKCVIAIIKSIHFAVSAKGFETRAHYPFNFNPHNFARPAGTP